MVVPWWLMGPLGWGSTTIDNKEGGGIGNAYVKLY